MPLFTREYSDNTADIEPYAIKYLSGGSYVIAGRLKAANNTHYDGMVMKVSADNIMEWSFTLGGSKKDIITGILALKNGDFLLYGSTASFGYNDEKAWLTRISGSGSLLWSRQIGLTANGINRVKAMIEMPDNSLAGCFNANDSSANSDAVIFKTTADGKLEWAHVFDNGGDDSYTSIAFNDDTLYAGGYYTNELKYGVITKLKGSDGTLISSQSIYNADNTKEQEVTSLEVYNNIISYGLCLYRNEEISGLVLRQTDLQDRDLYSRWIDYAYDTKFPFIKRTKDEGFLLLRTGKKGYGGPVINKFNRYGLDEWGTQLQQWDISQFNYSFDITPDGGCITAGFYYSYFNNFKNLVNVLKLNNTGFSACAPDYAGIHSDSGSCRSIDFTWQKEMFNSPGIMQNVNPVIKSFSPVAITLCDTSFCTDKTALPAGCSKTFRNEYVNDKLSGFKDMLTTNDGGKIAVGYLQNDALVVKLNKNSDVIWAKSYEPFAHNSEGYRIIKTYDNNFFVFAYSGYVVNHGVSSYSSILKINNNGDILWAKDIGVAQIGDVIATEDNGFVMVMNGAYGSGFTYSYVLRFDHNANIVWKKELKHNAATPVYHSVAISNNAIYISYDTYDNYNWDKFGIDKLDYATGNHLWSNRYATGTDNVERLIKMHIINDSVYLFINNIKPLGQNINSDDIVVVKINASGKIIQSFTLHPGTILPAYYQYYEVQNPPVITITPDMDFIFTSRVVNGTDTALNITRFTKDGQKIWSHNFAGMPNYQPWNVHPQADGFLIAGTATAKGPFYRNSFLIKVDKNGTIIPSASSGDCRYTDNQLVKKAIKINLSDNRIDSVVTLPDAYITKQTFLTQDVDLDAIPFCNISAACGTVGFKQKGNGCSLNDTLVYYLENAENCDAAATWSYDPAYFSAISISGQAIELKPLKNGVSKITANIEGNCSFKQQVINTSVLLSASQVNLGNDTVICNRNTIRLSAGPGYKTYTWQDNSTDSIFTATAPGIYYVTVTDNCGGTATDSILLQDASVAFVVTGDTIRCNNDSVLLKASSGYTNYQWSPSAALKIYDSIAYAAPNIQTLYYVQAINTYGCVLKDSVLVTPVTTPPVNLGNDTGFCSGSSLTLDAGGSFDKYLWNNGASTQNIKVSAKGVYYVKAYQQSCYSTDTLTVLDVTTPPVFTLGNDTLICAGSGIEYNFNLSGVSYAWSDGSVLSDKTITQPGKWWLTVTHTGCAAYDSVLIMEKPSPTVNLGNDTALCNADEKLLNATFAGAGYLWQDGSIASTYTVTKPGLYYVTVSLDECSADDSINISYITPPVFSLGKDTSICNGAAITLQPAMNTPAQYYWQNGSTQPTFTIMQPGNYYLKATNTCGSYTDSLLVTSAICDIVFPSAFTPNHDGLNDIFKIKYPPPVQSYNMIIYNRWGQVIFTSQNITKGWDGTYKGHPVNQDSFVWVVSITDINGRKTNLQGTVTVIR